MAMCDGVTQVITLPYFKNHYDNGEYVFIIVIGMTRPFFPPRTDIRSR